MADRTIVTGRLRVVGRFAFGDGAVVATKAATHDRVVIDSNDRGPAHYSVALLAGNRRRNMRRMPAGRGYAIVAVDAIAGNAAMVVDHVCPGECSMTIVANLAALQMRTMLAGRDDAIVATLAASDYRDVIDLEYIGPACSTMTVVAITRGADMLRRSRTGADFPADCVTIRALVRRAAKYSFQVTGIASDDRMGRIERKGGFIVIESSLFFGSLRRSENGYQGQQKKYQPGRWIFGKTSHVRVQSGCPIDCMSIAEKSLRL